MYINSFITELNKKLETLDHQLADFESKMSKINETKNMIGLKTLKDINELVGKDLVLLNEKDFSDILEVFEFNDIDERVKTFKKFIDKVKKNQKLLGDDQIDIDKNSVSSEIKWLDEQALYIKEYINDFNKNNKEYYNSLKISDSLYKKYLSYFKNNKLIKPIYDIDELNEVIKKSGLIANEKWQLIKYVGEMNMELEKTREKDINEKVEYTDEEILGFVQSVLSRESKLLKSINTKVLNEALDIIDYDEEKLNSMKLNSKSLVKYQKIPIIDAMNKIYKETKDMLKDEKDEDAIKIENNLKDLLQLVDSYDVIKKIES